MKIILNAYDYRVVIHVKFHQVFLVIEELMPFDSQNFNDCVVLSHNVSNGWNFMKLTINVYEHLVVLYVNV